MMEGDNVFMNLGITQEDFREMMRIYEMVIPKVEFLQEVKLAHRRMGISGIKWNVMALVELQDATERLGMRVIQEKAVLMAVKNMKYGKDLGLARRIGGSSSIF